MDVKDLVFSNSQLKYIQLKKNAIPVTWTVLSVTLIRLNRSTFKPVDKLAMQFYLHTNTLTELKQ